MGRLVLLAFIWGWSFLFIKVAVRGFTPTTVAGGRILLGLAVVWVAMRARGLRLPRDARSWRHFTVMALSHSSIPFVLVAWGEERITSALTAVLNASTGLMTAVAVAVYLGERLTRAQRAGLVLGLAGVAVAAGLGTGDITGSAWTGAAACVGAAACYGAGFAYAQRHLVDTPRLVAATGQLVVAAALSLPFAIVTSATVRFEATPTRVLALALLGTVGTGYAYILNYRTLAELGATQASLVTYLVVVVAVVVGVVLLDEPFEPGLVVGGALVVLGILLVQQRFRRFRRPPVIAVAAVLLAAFGIGGCGQEEGGQVATATTAATVCGPPVQEPLDPNSGQHVLPGAPEPAYRTDPPTSGAHRLAQRPEGGVVTEPLPRPVQVGLLEDGVVLVQVRDPAAARPLSGAVVAPNPGLTAPVVVTAWTWKMTCRGVDRAAIEAFTKDHGRPPAHS